MHSRMPQRRLLFIVLLRDLQGYSAPGRRMELV